MKKTRKKLIRKKISYLGKSSKLPSKMMEPEHFILVYIHKILNHKWPKDTAFNMDSYKEMKLLNMPKS